tara:strand:- start:377 stop:544 length:168 start_codon:yes stop_codon:yes gene_type:complete
MKVELTRAEIERIVLVHLNGLIPNQNFNTVEGTSYRDLPNSVVVFSLNVEEDAAQ